MYFFWFLLNERPLSYHFHLSVSQSLIHSLSRSIAHQPDDGDASLKKNLALTKKLRNLTKDQIETLSLDIQGCKSSKFMGEIVSAILENKWKKTMDIKAAATVSCANVKRARTVGLEQWDRDVDCWCTSSSLWWIFFNTFWGARENSIVCWKGKGWR